MPVYLRNFYYKKLIDIKKEESDQIEQAQNKSKVHKPSFQERFNR